MTTMLYISEVKDDCDTTDDGKQIRSVFVVPHQLTYRESVSLNSFFYGKRQRCWKSRKKGAVHLYTCRHSVEWNLHSKFMADSVEWEYIPTTGLWDFYNKIGYDYKKKKWTW